MIFHKRFSIIIFLFFVAAICSTSPAFSSPEVGQKEREQTYKKLELFSNVLSILQENYVEEIDTNKVIEGAINGLLLSLDPHSAYLPPDSFQELQDETQGSFTGIGIEITIKNGKLTVVSPIEDTPAYNAGVKVNDTIVKIGDQWTDDMSPLDAVKKLRGPKGSEVTISIHRQGWENIKEITLVRDIIPVHSVRSVVIAKGIVYTRITNFQSHTTDDYIKALDTLQQSQPIDAIILDLRNNPGGLLNQAVSIADYFLDSGLIVYTKGRTEDQNMVFQARQSASPIKVPLIVLVNEGSASASEIVAGAIQDQKRGLVVGTQTFGKGSVQTIVPLQDGAGLRMTTARYYTPSGKSIQAMGITPDIEVPYIPYSEPAVSKTEPNGFPREADLKNHFLNSEIKKLKELPNTEEKNPLDRSETETGLIPKLEKDNQVQMAVNILKGVMLLQVDTTLPKPE
jgi:carboxyl-terminal processing protease